MRKVAIPLAILTLIGLDQWVKHWVVANIALACVLVFVGFFLYKESLSLRQLIGIGVCVFGLFLIK